MKLPNYKLDFYIEETMGKLRIADGHMNNQSVLPILHQNADVPNIQRNAISIVSTRGSNTTFSVSTVVSSIRVSDEGLLLVLWHSTETLSTSLPASESSWTSFSKRGHWEWVNSISKLIFFQNYGFDFFHQCVIRKFWRLHRLNLLEKTFALISHSELWYSKGFELC